MYFNFDETISIFKLLLINNETFYEFLNFLETNNILLYGIILSSLASILLFANKFEFKKFTIFLDYFSIIIINYYFTPLIAFTIYFCFLHSIRHSISLMIELDDKNLKNGFFIFFKKALPLTILTAFLFTMLYPRTPLVYYLIFSGLPRGRSNSARHTGRSMRPARRLSLFQGNVRLRVRVRAFHIFRHMLRPFCVFGSHIWIT